MIDVDYFSKFDTGHFDKSGNPMSFTFIDNHADNLVVTVGCSWTWGANMTSTDDEEHRLTNNFGRILSNSLDADWLLLGQVGTGNFWLYQKVQELAKLIPTLKYKKIYVVCTFTEIGRQCNTELDQHIDYKDYFRSNKYGTALLEYLNDHAVKQIVNALKPFDNVTLRIGTNFVDHIGFEQAKDYLIPKPWLEYLSNDYSDTCYTIGHLAIGRLKTLQKYTHDGFGFMIWLDELVSNGLKRIQLCQRCNLLMPGSGHPGAEGHKMWAQEILKTL